MNQKQTYTAAFPIALKELNNTTQYRLVAIDNDKDAGVHKNDESGPIVTRNIDYYNVLTNLINPNTASTFSVIHTSANPDDIYYKSGVIHINLSNVLARIGNGTDFNTDQAI